MERWRRKNVEMEEEERRDGQQRKHSCCGDLVESNKTVLLAGAAPLIPSSPCSSPPSSSLCCFVPRPLLICSGEEEASFDLGRGSKQLKTRSSKAFFCFFLFIYELLYASRLTGASGVSGAGSDGLFLKQQRRWSDL